MQALQLQFYEAVMMLFEREGAPEGAILFARAALQQLGATAFHHGGGGDASSGGRREATASAPLEGRLWANVFGYSCELGAFEDAYAAVLANPVPERALDCLRRLVHELCEDRRGGGGGRLLTLCSLPFAGTITVGGGSGVDGASAVPLVQEVVLSLQRRAQNSDLSTSPQPYRVLHDFLVSRSDLRGAARAMLAWARRMRTEGPVGAKQDVLAAYGEWEGGIGEWEGSILGQR